MTDYPMLYEAIVLAAWGRRNRREDPLRMGDADTLGLVSEDLSGRHAHEAIFNLSAALKKVALDNEGTAVGGILIELDSKLQGVKSYGELCQVLDKAKVLFESVGIAVV